jgi:hypothetical protein
MAEPEVTPEWKLLLTACTAIPQDQKVPRVAPLFRSQIRWDILRNLAERHGTLPLLHQFLAEIRDHVPPDELKRLDQLQQTNVVRSLLVARELTRIVERLNVLGLAAMPYKGPVLAELAYGDIGLRKSGDIDLLILRDEFAQVSDALREFGYTPNLSLSAAEQRAYLQSGYECVFGGPGGPNLLEVKWAIQPRFYAVEFDIGELFGRGVITTVAGQAMKTLSPEDTILVLCVHAAKHLWEKLLWLCDLSRLMTQTNLDWRRIGAQARELGIARILRITLILAHELLGSSTPASALREIPDDEKARLVATEIRQRILAEVDSTLDSTAYFRLILQLRERSADQVRFLRRLMLTPGPSEWRAVKLPQSLFPLYRLVRISRVTAKLAGF